jgi:cytochrome oxidase Cu insertion factor (SCO1/SenC/PrrC family)
MLKPFLTEHPIPYRILLGTDATAKSYGIENMPDTFLIDRKGRVAAGYRGTLVDGDEVAQHIESLLGEK